MEFKLTIRNSSKVFIKENGCTFVVYSIYENETYKASVEFNLTNQSCKILNYFKSIPKKDLENCVYNKRIAELKNLKSISNPETFEILNNLIKDLEKKIQK